MILGKLKVRLCQAEDLYFVHDLLKENMARLMFEQWGRKWDSESFWRKIKPEDITIIEYDAERVAFFQSFDDKGALHLLNIDVAKGFQNRGIGTHMLSLVEEKAREAGMPKIFLEVIPHNPSRYLYTRYGFKKVGMRDGCWVMEKMIDY